jgi:hypothetical protein
MSSFIECIICITEGRVLRVSLNHPGKRNALSLDLCRQLVETIECAAEFAARIAGFSPTAIRSVWPMLRRRGAGTWKPRARSPGVFVAA